MDLKIAIIGAGPAGIGAGRELLQQGFSDFTIFDALDAPGGTWRLHSYPGLACDVWAHYYTFSYAPNPDWSANFVGYAEIQAYLARCATQFGLDPHMQFNTRITAARYQASGGWVLETEAGETHRFDVVINAMGNQHTPLYPDVPGMDSFRGESFHATRWDHDVVLEGKRVLVVGSAASAVQIVPEVAEMAAQLTVLQRSANWIMPRNWKAYSDSQRRRWRHFPFLLRLIRKGQSILMGQVQNAVTVGHKRMGQFEQMVIKHIERTVDDPQVREALTPDTRYGCKRGLISDDFYPSFNRDNVELIHSGLRAVTPTGAITENGRELEVDVIIYCTGYRVMDFDRIEVEGVNGIGLADYMGDNPRAFKSISTPGFPNYFYAVGPNGLVLDVSYFSTIEKSLQSIVRLLASMRERNIGAIDVKAGRLDAYSDWMSARFETFSWGASDCHSYYRNASGHAPFLFPGNFKEFCRQQDAITLDDYDLLATASAAKNAA